MGKHEKDPPKNPDPPPTPPSTGDKQVKGGGRRER